MIVRVRDTGTGANVRLQYCQRNNLEYEENKTWKAKNKIIQPQERKHSTAVFLFQGYNDCFITKSFNMEKMNQ